MGFEGGESSHNVGGAIRIGGYHLIDLLPRL